MQNTIINENNTKEQMLIAKENLIPFIQKHYPKDYLYLNYISGTEFSISIKFNNNDIETFEIIRWTKNRYIFNSKKFDHIWKDKDNLIIKENE